MPSKLKTETAQGFAGSIFKYSIATFVNFGIYGLALLLTNFVLPDTTLNGEVFQFIAFTNTIMTIVVFGLDQSFIRFYNEPPGRLSGIGLFRLCFYLSTSILFVGGLVCTLFFATPLRKLFQFNLVGDNVIPLLFVSAFFWMVARYFFLLFRMQGHVLYYTIVTILMTVFYRLFFLLTALFTQDAWALMLSAAAGLGLFALFLLLWKNKLMRPQKTDLDRTALKVIVPFGAAVAPTAVMITLNSAFSSVFIAAQIDSDARGIYSLAIQLSNIVTSIQGGFASFWGAYMYANYKTEQERIIKMHDYLNFIILVFFCFLVAFEDVIFWVLSNFSVIQLIFPIVMLSAVFTILCETTVYGITIARKPIFDTIGIGLSFALNVLFLILLVPRFELIGAASALAIANFSMFAFRTFVAQRLYKSIASPQRTVLALGIALVVTVLGTVWYNQFVLRLTTSLLAIALYCLLYRKQLFGIFQLGMRIAKDLFARRQTDTIK